MEEIKNILQGPRSSVGATMLIKLYKDHSGNQLKVGCFCKEKNVHKVYDIVQEWYNTTTNN
jgi:hypothetical protein